ncbi:hypothetical protein BDR05DRAFT_373286 [Suillus weaverae]|nr:hypothetical protein BDR05DRAFT_373286 [Suillus weaverae]
MQVLKVGKLIHHLLCMSTSTLPSVLYTSLCSLGMIHAVRVHARATTNKVTFTPRCWAMAPIDEKRLQLVSDVTVERFVEDCKAGRKIDTITTAMCVYFSVTLHLMQRSRHVKRWKIQWNIDQLARRVESARAPEAIVEAEPSSHL